jgi:CubicO group peptidase (beta-lactamase class C family)
LRSRINSDDAALHSLGNDMLVAPGFELVAEEFERNFAERGELGAAFAAVRDGELVVDLWGGIADGERNRLWERDTLQLIFSGTKGLVAICMLMLIDRGVLDPDERVQTYWPEFGTPDKADILVRDIASHQAGLPGIRENLREKDILNGAAMASLLAAQPRERDDRAHKAYHALTFGWLCGEVIKRVDGRSVGTFFDQEVAQPLGLEIWIGLPKALEERVSTLTYGPTWGAKIPDERAFAEDSLLSCVWNNPPLFPTDHIPWNTQAFHQAEIPGGGAIGSARSIARLYGCLARGGDLGGVHLLSPETIDRGRRYQAAGFDPLTDEPTAYGLGFELQTELMRLGPPENAFGHSGAGGSVHGAWPAQGVGYSYCMNQMRDDAPVDGRPHALLEALYGAL